MSPDILPPQDIIDEPLTIIMPPVSDPTLFLRVIKLGLSEGSQIVVSLPKGERVMLLEAKDN